MTRPDHQPPPPEQETPLSLNRLRAAFAQMLGEGQGDNAAAPASADLAHGAEPVPDTPVPDPCEINPRSVVEAMLFVGRPDDRPLSAREMAAAMRGVSPAELEAAVKELNQTYNRDAAPYEIVGNAQGYRLALRDDFRRLRDKFHGRLKEAKLSPAALEVLSIVAYQQPTTSEAVSELRGVASGPALASLVRRKLVRLDRPAEHGERTRYSTTDRFLQVFGLSSIAELPRSEELEKI